MRVCPHESVRLAEEAEIDLLLHGRAADALVTADIEGGLRRKLLEARRFVTTRKEARVLAESEQVGQYIAASRNPKESIGELTARHEPAYAALERLVSINVPQSKAAQQDAAHWNRLGDVFGIGVGAPLLVVTGALIIWLKRRAFEPIFGLAAAMERLWSRSSGCARGGEGPA